MIDYRKCAVVPMISEATGEAEFELLIYGYSARELMTVPNAVISALAGRYPGFTSSPFLVRDNRPNAALEEWLKKDLSVR